MKKRYLLLQVFSCLFIAGCATQYQAYSGPPVPDTQVAVLHVNCPGIVSVDGKKVMLDSVDKVMFKPGNHILGVTDEKSELVYGGIHSGNLSFPAIAGTEYDFNCDVRGGYQSFYYIVDKNSNKVISKIVLGNMHHELWYR